MEIFNKLYNTFVNNFLLIFYQLFNKKPNPIIQSFRSHNSELKSFLYSHQTANNGRNANMQNIIQQSTSTIETVTVAEGNRDDTTEYSIANAETVVMTGNDIEMKIKGSYPPEFRGIPPPPAFVNRFDIACEPNTSNAKTDEYQQK